MRWAARRGPDASHFVLYLKMDSSPLRSCDDLGAAATQVSDQLAAARTVSTSPAPRPPSPASPPPHRAQPQPTRTTVARHHPAPRDHAAPDGPQRDKSDAVPPLKAGARRMLHTLARHHPTRVTRAQLATLSRFKATGGTFNTYYSTLRRTGLITEQQGLIELTDARRAAAGVSIAAPASTAELLEQWRTALKAGARTMLDLLIDAYPNALTRDELAQRAGYEISGGTFNTYLSTLRRNGLADITGDAVRANDVLFLATTPPPAEQSPSEMSDTLARCRHPSVDPFPGGRRPVNLAEHGRWPP